MKACKRKLDLSCSVHTDHDGFKQRAYVSTTDSSSAISNMVFGSSNINTEEFDLPGQSMDLRTRVCGWYV
jgi:hypothetical protein